jgi:molecular chaperone GrpE
MAKYLKRLFSQNKKNLNSKMNTEETKIEEQENTEQKISDTNNNEEIITKNINDQTIETAISDQFEAKYKEVNDKYLRLYSDFDNFRKRNAKEKIDLIQHASSSVITDLLPALDDFERAMKFNENTEDLTILKDGFNLIYSKLKNVLEQKGLKEIKTEGEYFDTDLHEAITNIPALNDDLKGKCVDVAEKGYYLNDKVIRYAKVIVGQ